MPESKKRRRKRVYYPGGTPSRRRPPSPPWLAPLMLAFFLVGIAWIVVFYVSPNMGGIPGLSSLGSINMLIGFGFIIAGFGLATQWR